MKQLDRLQLHSRGGEGVWPERVECIHCYALAAFDIRDWLKSRLSPQAYRISKADQIVIETTPEHDPFDDTYSPVFVSFMIHFADVEEYVVFALTFAEYFVK